MIVGNVVDNINNPVVINVALQLALSVIWILTGLWIRHCINEDGETTYSSAIMYLANLGELTSAGIILINILQVYNWTSHKMICTAMSCYFGV